LKKILLITLGIIVVLSVLGWLNRESWLADFNADRAYQTAEFKKSGRLFGQEHNQQACLDKTLRSFDGCLGFSCTVNQGIFLRACLSVAKASPGFCEGVPPYREKPTEDDKSWAKYYCWDRNIRGEGCRLLMKQQQFFCSQ